MSIYFKSLGFFWGEAKFGNLSSIPWTHVGEMGNKLPQLLSGLHMHTVTWALSCTRIYNV